MKTKSDRETNSAAPFGGARYHEAKTVMPLLGYRDRGAFFAAVRAAGVPFIKFNQRKILFEESAVQAWLDSRRVGGATK